MFSLLFVYISPFLEEDEDIDIVKLLCEILVDVSCINEMSAAHDTFKQRRTVGAWPYMSCYKLTVQYRPGVT